jgi:hypothetical protein
MKNLSSLPGFIVLILLSISLINQPTEAQNRYVEDFSTTLYKDEANTTALWDVSTGELKLPPFELTLAGSYDTPGSAYNVAIDGDYAYVADYTGHLQVIDISDPANPTLAGSVGGINAVYGIAVDGDYAYLAASTHFYAINISDPTNPVLAGTYTTADILRGVSISGDYAYVAGYSLGLKVIDISDPTNPLLAGSYTTSGYSSWNVDIDGDYAYLASTTYLRVIDISDPTSPTLACNYTTPGSARGVAVSGDYVYVADGASGLEVMDISDPTNPILVGSYNTPQNALNLAISGDYAYVADGSSGLQVVDISDPTNPISCGSYDTPGDAWGVAISGNYAYVADFSMGLQVIIVSYSISPIYAGDYNTPGRAYGIGISGDYAYIADGSRGLRVLDISEPTNPFSIGYLDIDYYDYRDVVISGDYAYIAAELYGLRVIDISDPSNPISASGYSTPGAARGVFVNGNYAYIADGGYGLQVFDITDPTVPILAGNYNTPDEACQVTISGNYAYVADKYSGLQVINISVPTNPILAGSYATSPGGVFSVAISGDYAYLYVSSSDLQVIDISDPSHPTYVNNCDLPGSGYDIAVSGDYIYLAGGTTGLQVVDISNPTEPTLIGNYDTPSTAWGVVVSGNYAYVSCDEMGLQVIKVFQRTYNLNDIDSNIIRARIITIQSNSISWELSPNNGADWEAVAPNGSWHRFSAIGDQLIWRSTHIYAGGDVNPTCSNLEIDWFYNCALIDSIVDVPDDQGSWLRLYFTRSGLDFADEPTYPITSYYVFRRIDDIGLQKRIINQGQIPEEQQAIISDLSGSLKEVPRTIANSPVYSLEGRYYLTSGAQSVQDLPPGTWEVVGSVPAHQEDQYICLVPSLADSATELIYSVYCISAETTTPSIFYFSPPDSGCSIDNIAPSPPPSLNATQVGNHSVELIWDSNRTYHDWHYFAVHRSLTPDFTPDASSFLVNTIDTVFMDNDPYDMVNSYYKIVSYDVHGNPSLPSVQAVIYFDSSLPVTLLTFEAELNLTGTINISFSTASEINIAGYNIWRSESENEGYNMIASYVNHTNLAARGSSSYGWEYSWQDMNTESNKTYWYKLECVEVSGTKYFYGPVSVEVNIIPREYTLYQNYPNPFNAATHIRYSLPYDEYVVLEIWNLQGQKVATLVDGEQQAGYKIVSWNANSQASGIYFYRLRTSNFVKTKRMQLMK